MKLKHNRFERYKSPVFIETGSYCGEGIEGAITANFKTIYSIELSEHYYKVCQELFKGNKNVHLLFGDSVEVLPKLLKTLDCQCTFWLDGHWCGDVSAGESNPVPLMEELQAIKEHHRKDHIILIDDMRLLRTHDAEWKDLKYSVLDLEKMLRSINPQYNIFYESGVTPDDVLIAHL